MLRHLVEQPMIRLGRRLTSGTGSPQHESWNLQWTGPSIRWRLQLMAQIAQWKCKIRRRHQEQHQSPAL
jgi:hypothetical protein